MSLYLYLLCTRTFLEPWNETMRLVCLNPMSIADNLTFQCTQRPPTNMSNDLIYSYALTSWHRKLNWQGVCRLQYIDELGYGHCRIRTQICTSSWFDLGVGILLKFDTFWNPWTHKWTFNCFCNFSQYAHSSLLGLSSRFAIRARNIKAVIFISTRVR